MDIADHFYVARLSGSFKTLFGRPAGVIKLRLEAINLLYNENVDAVNPMTLPHKQRMILIADRNPHVRGYLKREILSAGYRVTLARTCRDVIETINSSQHIDGIIIDPDLPGAEIGSLQGTLKASPQPIPIVIHSLLKNNGQDFFFYPEEITVEKGWASAEQLKQALVRLFGPTPPVHESCPKPQKTEDGEQVQGDGVN